MDDRFEKPEIFYAKSQDLPLSGKALLELMQAVLARGRPFRFCARGWSMTPFIRDRDVITVSPRSGDLPEVGEIVAFVRPEEGQLVVHRVIARHGRNLCIQGDNGLDEADEFIPSENLLGRVTMIERNGRRVWLGLGPERYLIAFLSRTRLLAFGRGITSGGKKPPAGR